jgi:hypothetical protein
MWGSPPEQIKNQKGQIKLDIEKKSAISDIKNKRYQIIPDIEKKSTVNDIL